MSFPTQAEAKAASHFSRQHKNSDAHTKARETYLARVDGRYSGPKERAKARAKLSNLQQLKELNARCRNHEGGGAKRERARLIASNSKG